jgi:hypothetical protein
MSTLEDKQDLDADDDVAAQKDDEQAAAEDAGAADSDAAAPDTQAEEEAEKEQIAPSLTVTSPGSGAQFPGGEPIAVEFDCEGDTEFTAHVAIVDANGTQVLEDSADLKLEENQGHGAFALADEALVAGKYDVMVWGDSNGQATAVQKLQVEVVDTEAEEEPEPQVAVEGDDDKPDAAA